MAVRGTSGECLVREHFGRVWGYVRLRVAAADREDVVAEVFLRALERRGQLRSRDPGGWLLSIARSRVADYHRRRRDDMARHVPGSRTQATPLEELERKEFLALLRRKMTVLSETERDVVALKFTEGLSNGEIAGLLGVTANHLGVMLHRALGRLKGAMLKEVGDGIP